MGKTVDDKVVSMSFESTKFEIGVAKTMSALDKLKAALHFPNAGKGMGEISAAASKVDLTHAATALDKLKSSMHFPQAGDGFSQISKAAGKVDLTPAATALDKLKGAFHFPEAANSFNEIQRAADQTDLSNISNNVDAIRNKFSALNAAMTAVIFNMTHRFVNAGVNLAKSITVAPIMDGFHEYETNLNSIQTVLANTKDQGTTLKDVNKALQNLNTYSDKTIYNFSQMARNIGTFTAAGVNLKTATTSIKGIANLAAVSGSSAEQASTAMYQLSQAIASGRVSLQDWNSVVNAGMGGAVFQKALMRTAQAMGALKDGAVKVDKATGKATVNGESFRESIMAKPGEQSWLTSDVLTKTLSQLSGDMTDAQLKAQGFTDAQIKAIQAQAKMAVDAATKVKTLSQLLDTIKEAVGSGWAQTWQTIFGDFGEAKHLFTSLSNSIGGFVQASSKARNAVLKDWKKMGGRTLLIDAIKTTFQNLGKVIAPIKDAFRDIFPKKTAEDLLNMTATFDRFAHALKPSKETVENLRRTFRGLFSIFDIGKQIIGGIFTGLKTLLGMVGQGSGGVLNFTGNVGDLITKFDLFLRQTDVITTFFKGLGQVLHVPIQLIGDLADALTGLFGGGANAGKDVASSFDEMAASIKPSTKVINIAAKAWEGFLHILQNVADAFKPVLQGISDAFSNIGSAIADAISNNDFSNVFSVIQTGLVAGIFLSIKKAIGGGLSLELGTGGALQSVTKSLDTLKGSLVSIQNNIKAHTMLTIASAVALLAGATVALSLIDPAKLTKAMTALTVSMGQLMGSLFIMDKVGGKAGFVKAPLIAASLVAIAAAVDILVLAVVGLAQLSWEQLAKGLAGLTGMLVALGVAVVPLSLAGPGLLIAGPALIAVGLALNVIALSMKIFATMKWEDIGKGLAAIGAVLLVIAATTFTLSPLLPATAAGLILVSVALIGIAGAIKIMGSMDLATLAKGIGAIALTLALIAATTFAMSPLLPVTGAGLILVGAGLAVIAGAIKLMGSQSLGTLAKGIGAIAATLAVLAIGLTLMIVALPGAAALVVAAGGLAILLPVLATMGHMKFKTIFHGLAAIAISMGALALVGMTTAPGIIALAAALGLLGVALTLVGAGIYLMTSGLVKLAGPGAKGIGIVLASFTAFVAILPKIIINFVKGLVEIVAAIADVAPKVAASMVKITIAILNGVIKAAPKMAEAAIVLIGAFLKVLNEKAGPIIQAGWGLLLNLLKGIKDHIVDATKLAVTIVVRFLGVLASKASQLAAAGAKLLANLLLGIARNLGKVVTAVGTIVVKFLGALSGQYKKIITAGANLVIKLVAGIVGAIEKIVKAAIRVAARFIVEIAREIPKRVDQVASAMIDMINALADVIEKRTPEFLSAIARLGTAFIRGLADWIRDNGGGQIRDALLSLVPGPVKKVVGKVLGAAKSAGSTIAHAGSAIAVGLSTGFVQTIGPEFDSKGNIIAKAIASAVKKNAIQIRELGSFLGDEFKKGLVGDLLPPDSAVDTAFKGFTDELKSKATDVKKSISDTTKKIRAIDKELRDKPIADTPQEIVRQKKIIAERVKLIDQLTGYYDTLGKIHKAEALVKQGLYTITTDEGTFTGKDFIEKKIDELDKLNDKIDKVKDLVQSLKDQYSTLPDLVFTNEKGHKVDSVKEYKKNLAKRIAAIKKFRSTLNQLKDLGLDNTTLQMLLNEGIDAQPFIDQLLKGGKASVDEITSLDSDLASTTDGFADDMAANMFGAGVKAGEGFVAGLEKQKANLTQTIIGLADSFVATIKLALGIKSPSTVFAEIGKNLMLGWGKGIEDSSHIAAKAITNSLKSIHDAVSANVDMNPVITPVLDLSNIQNGSKEMGKILNAPLNVAAPIDPSAISPGGVSGEGSQTDPAVVKFEQNNYSPKALSPIEIYRQTRNQLSQAKPILVPQ